MPVRDRSGAFVERRVTRRRSALSGDDGTGQARCSREKSPAVTRLNKQDFLDWAYDDLFTNTTRGVLAEYIVATALGITKTRRREWDQYDLQFGDVGVEVKSAAYVQAWKQARPSKITFSIRPLRGAHTDALSAGGVPGRYQPEPGLSNVQRGRGQGGERC